MGFISARSKQYQEIFHVPAFIQLVGKFLEDLFWVTPVVAKTRLP